MKEIGAGSVSQQELVVHSPGNGTHDNQIPMPVTWAVPLVKMAPF